MKDIMKRLKRNKRGVSNVVVVMLSLVLIVIIVGNVILWSYQMNQLDLERIQEKVIITSAEQTTRSSWFRSQSEYNVNPGTRLDSTYSDTETVDNNSETFREEAILANYPDNPSGYSLGGSTRCGSGTTADLATENGVYMVFGSYPSNFSSQTLYAHGEVLMLAGTSYYRLKPNGTDSAGLTLQADASTTGRKLVGKFVCPLNEIDFIPASTWTMYYRAYTGPSSFVTAHCDVDILIRMSNGTVRSNMATNVADSNTLTSSWSTLSGNYSWTAYTVADQSDYLEIDYYTEVTTGFTARQVYLRIDDSTLATNDQTRMTASMSPNRYTVDVEIAGSSNTQNWQSLVWTMDSAFSTSNVNTTLQLYDYSTAQYPMGGDGYITYNSSSTPSTDETKDQTISSNPTRYRNSTGGWKIKITGVKDTASPFDLKIDWVEFKTVTADVYRLNVINDFAMDLATYPPNCVRGIEITIRYNVTENSERWFLKAYNWTTSSFTDSGFNSTQGNQPVLNQWNDYAVNITDGSWMNYVNSNGTVHVGFLDEGAVANQTVVGIDFFAVRAIIDGAKFTVKNSSPFTTHVVAVWILNSANHRRYEANLFINSGESVTYICPDLELPEGDFIAKVVTERGNMAVFP